MAAKAAFLTTNLAAGLTPTATSSATAAGLGWDRLNDPQPRHRARVAATSAILVLDLGSAQSVDCAGLISTNLPSTATIRLRANSSDSWGSNLSDSGVLSSVTDPAYNGNAFVILGAPVSARYWRWDITGANPIDIGLAPIGLLFRPSRNFSYGAQEGRTDFSTRVTNPDTGADFCVPGPTRRAKLITFKGLTKTEARTYIDAMDRVTGAGGDVLYVEMPDDTPINAARDSIWGAFRGVGGLGQSGGASAAAMGSGADYLTRDASQAWSRAFTMSERL